jgi:putative transposase
MGTVCWTFNACNAAMRAGLSSHSKAELQSRFVDNEAFGKPSKRKKKKAKVAAPFSERGKELLAATRHLPGPSTLWVLNMPRDIQDQAAKELSAAYKNGAKVHGQGKFEVKFKSPKKMAQQCITINARDWGRGRTSIYHGLFDSGRALRASEPLPREMEHEFKIVRTRLGRYYLCVPTDLETRGESQAPSSADDVGAECVFIDPGVRTFLTTFDLSGRVHEFGTGSFGCVEKLCRRLDDLISRTYTKKPDDGQSFLHGKKRRWRMRRAALRMRRRIRDLIDEAHRKITLWLCENHRVILWPLSGVSAMVAKEDLKQHKRRIGSRSVRAMLTWSWYRFQEWLKHKAREFPWCRLVLASRGTRPRPALTAARPTTTSGGARSSAVPTRPA